MLSGMKWRTVVLRGLLSIITYTKKEWHILVMCKLGHRLSGEKKADDVEVQCNYEHDGKHSRV